MNEKYRIGNGYDIHRLAKDRKLILGGVEVPFEKGLLGHSDADALTHAIMDALLGALSLGDIGQHFPPNKPEFKDISSLELLKRVYEMIKKENYAVVNIDSVIQAENPKLMDYIPAMKSRVAEVLEIQENQISIKATTMEGLGAIGEGRAIDSSAVVLLYTMEKNEE